MALQSIKVSVRAPREDSDKPGKFIAIFVFLFKMLIEYYHLLVYILGPSICLLGPSYIYEPRHVISNNVVF